jgi:hypothetical protein
MKNHTVSATMPKNGESRTAAIRRGKCQHCAKAWDLSYFLAKSILLCLLIGGGRDYNLPSRVEIRSGHDSHQGPSNEFEEIVRDCSRQRDEPTERPDLSPPTAFSSEGCQKTGFCRRSGPVITPTRCLRESWKNRLPNAHIIGYLCGTISGARPPPILLFNSFHVILFTRALINVPNQPSDFL